jgi:hypothetical protein
LVNAVTVHGRRSRNICDVVPLGVRSRPHDLCRIRWNAGAEAHPVDRVIVTQADHDFVDLEVKPSRVWTAAALAAVAVAPYRSTEVTYDLTLDELHTYCVYACDTLVLVHSVWLEGSQLRGRSVMFCRPSLTLFLASKVLLAETRPAGEYRPSLGRLIWPLFFWG